MLTTRALVTLLIASAASCAGDRAGSRAAMRKPNTSPTTSSEVSEPMFSEADAYERFMGRWSRLLAPLLVELCGVRDGNAVLDVGTGTGALAFAVHDATRTSRITGIDPSAASVNRADANSNDARIRFELGDAQALRFPDAQFDTTLALLVMNFIPDHDKAVAEMRRVTRAQGTVSACVWDYDDGMQMLRFFWDEAVRLNPAIEPGDERHMKFSRRGQLGDLWRKAGLVGVREAPLTIEQAYASFDDYWQPFTKGAGPGGAYVVSLPEDRRYQLEGRLRKRLLGDRQDGPFTLTARAWCVRGEVPGN